MLFITFCLRFFPRLQRLLSDSGITVPLFLFICFSDRLLRHLTQLFLEGHSVFWFFFGFQNCFDAVLNPANQVGINILIFQYLGHFCPMCFQVFQFPDEFVFVRGLYSICFQILHCLDISRDFVLVRFRVFLFDEIESTFALQIDRLILFKSGDMLERCLHSPDSPIRRVQL